MKKIITTVGTSLFENYIRENEEKQNFKNIYQYFKNKELNADDLDKNQQRKNTILKEFHQNYFKNNFDASAEIKSLIKLKQELKEDFDIYLLYSDTALSRLAAEILGEYIHSYEELEKSHIQLEKIENLQVKDRKKFIEGMSNLINIIYKISQNYWSNIIINITGGYKATIPYLTILSQVNQCPIYYIFEETDSLIQIPNIPLDIKWEIFDKYWEIFSDIEKENIVEEKKLSYEFRNDCISLFEIEYIDHSKYYALNPLGEILWKKYKEKYFIYYSPEEVQKEIEKTEIQRIIQSKFSNFQLRVSKTEIKNNHYVYDDGDNPYRIFYFEEKDLIYIYKIFDNHDKYVEYLNNNPFNEQLKNAIKAKSKSFKLEVSNV